MGENGASGASFTDQCTPGASAASITDFMNAHLPAAGWIPWNTQRDSAGCPFAPGVPVAAWSWYKPFSPPLGGFNADALGWSFAGMPASQWVLVVCNRGITT